MSLITVFTGKTAKHLLHALRHAGKAKRDAEWFLVMTSSATVNFGLLQNLLKGTNLVYVHVPMISWKL